MLIRNINGTSRYRDLYGHESWIDYWCKHRYKVYVCASCGNGCYHDLVGAHVQKVNSNDKSGILYLFVNPAIKRMNPLM